ncbi:class I SAM-dependent methyltransferase [Dactylosporangium sp. NPDC048998]|uniref:class I SAM-dependent methyltransferase n=1 Tax=Dactylosporangium sp. NPDC048998 TaxID=3363976 RepID=UPI00371574A7
MTGEPMVAAASPRAGARLDRLAPLSLNAWLRLDVVSRLFPAGVRDVLEIGCGQGGFGARLAQRYDYVGIEPDPASFAVAEQRLRLAGAGGVARVANIRLEELPAARFDVVCAFEVLEHLEDDAAALAAWAARLRPGGWLLLSVPAYQHRYGPADELVGHFRRYDPAALHALLTGAGLTDVRLCHYGMPLGYLLEAARNRLARRRLRSVGDATAPQRSAASGRLLQPSAPLRGLLHRWGTAPFRWAQRAAPNTGPGLIAAARLAASHVGAGPHDEIGEQRH